MKASRSLVMIWAFAMQLLGGCAQSPPPAPVVSVSGVHLQLPSTGHWQVFHTSQAPEAESQSVVFVEADAADRSRIRSLFRLTVMSLEAAESTRGGADACLARVSRITRGTRQFKSLNVRSACRTTSPGNQYTADWFQANGEDLKEILAKAGLRFVDRGVGELAVSVPYGSSRRLSVLGYMTMGAPAKNAVGPTEAAKRRLATFALAISQAISDAVGTEELSVQFPSPEIAGALAP